MSTSSSPMKTLSFARVALLVITFLACSQLASAAPRRKPATLTNPHPTGPTPSSKAPTRPKIQAYGDFDRHFGGKRRNWRQNHGKGHAWKRDNIVLDDFEADLAFDKEEFARRYLDLKEDDSVLVRRQVNSTSTSASSSSSEDATSSPSSTNVSAAGNSSSSSSVVSSSPSSASAVESSSASSTSSASVSATSTLSSLVPTSTLAPCVGSEANASYISSLFAYGGIGYTVELCPGADIALEQAIFIWWANQTLTTQGNPTGETRATLTIASADITCAIFAALNYVDHITISSIQVDGARPTYGIYYGGIALIEIGGYTIGHTVKHVHAFEPRGWSALHIAEGYLNFCSGAQILNNQIGPAGHAPSGAQQFKRDSTGTYTPGQWADGISHACRNSLVQGNTITDTTDGGIVVFGALGSQITGNTIIANDRQALGGINMVDWAPYAGAFTGTVVSNNQINSQASLIKLGIAVGTMSWGTDNRTIARTFDGEIKNNVFSSGPTGYFGYSISVAGHENITISGNTAANANFGGVESSSCFTYWFPLPTPQPFIADPWTTPGCQFQSDFLVNTTLVLPVCRGPKP